MTPVKATAAEHGSHAGVADSVAAVTAALCLDPWGQQYCATHGLIAVVVSMLQRHGLLDGLEPLVRVAMTVTVAITVVVAVAATVGVPASRRCLHS